MKQASLALKEAGAKRVVELKVSGPFHSLLLKPAGEALLKEMESMSFSPLQVPYIANATAEIVTDSKRSVHFLQKEFILLFAGSKVSRQCLKTVWILLLR